MKNLIIAILLCVPGLSAEADFPAWSDWSRNNILDFYSPGGCGCEYADTASVFGPLIIADSGHTNTTEIGNISRNYWGDTAILPENDTVSGCNSIDTFGSPSTWKTGSSSLMVAQGICFNADSNFKTWQHRIPGVIDCEEPMPATKKKGAQPESILVDTTCQVKYAIGVQYNNGNDFVDGYQALTWYLESCYASTRSWQGFGDLDNSVAGMSSDPSRFQNYRVWLKSVLWLNTTDPLWYCTCAESIYGTYVPLDGGANLNAAIAVIRYLDSAKRCPMDSVDNHVADSQIIAERHTIWLDTIHSLHHGDTTGFSEDTTIPTIDDLGLQVLRGLPAMVDTSSSPQTGIGALTASENPFTKETTVSFSMGEYAYISFQVFDVLGTVMEGDYKGTVIGPGEHSFTVDGSNWPAGTYYARITTPIGETRMIKLVKE